MNWTRAAAVLLMAGGAWTQHTALTSRAAGAGPADRPSKNIALDAQYTLQPAPDYEHCTDAADVKQLTDGVYHQTEESLWTQLSTVGWQEKQPVIITLDLGKVKPIRGVSFHTAGGRASVKWPATIRIFTADEDKEFHEIGELLSLSAQHGPPVPTAYGTHRYWTDQLRTHGRYVCLAVWSEPFTFVDEIEVYAGMPEWLIEPLPGPGIAENRMGSGLLGIQAGIRNRLEQDIRALRNAAQEEGVPVQTKQNVLRELAAVEGELGQAYRTFAPDFRTVLPLNSWHRRVLGTQAWLWRANGLAPVTFWCSDLWDPLRLVGMPDMAAELAVEVHLMRKEYRAAAFNVSNSSDTPIEVRFRLSGLPGGDNPGYVAVHEVAWTRHGERGASGRGPTRDFCCAGAL